MMPVILIFLKKKQFRVYLIHGFFLSETEQGHNQPHGMGLTPFS